MGFRVTALLLLLASSGLVVQAGMTSYTDKGKTDFDTALVLLNPYGTWAKIGDLWAYTPLGHPVPFTEGQWIYTEYGWDWKGRRPESWATEHYGYWQRNPAGVWSWFPGSFWLPEPLELRSTATHIGWRSGAVDEDGNFIEAAADRWARSTEWSFVTLAQFAGPITPTSPVGADQSKQLLDESTDSVHSYHTYRDIDRPGPHPADFVALAKPGGMFPPRTLEDDLADQAPKPAAPKFHPPPMTGTNAPPALVGTDADPAADQRQVKYWITMSLPTYWTQPPAGAKPGEIYLYRPDFYQDHDGIERRITLWFNPKSHVTLQEALTGAGPVMPTGTAATAHVQPAPAEPVEPSRDPFHSPFDDSFRPSPGGHSSSSKTPPPASSGDAVDPGQAPTRTNAPPSMP